MKTYFIVLLAFFLALPLGAITLESLLDEQDYEEFLTIEDVFNEINIFDQQPEGAQEDFNIGE